jgi:hypothetical protein
LSNTESGCNLATAAEDLLLLRHNCISFVALTEPVAAALCTLKVYTGTSSRLATAAYTLPVMHCRCNITVGLTAAAVVRLVLAGWRSVVVAPAVRLGWWWAGFDGVNQQQQVDMAVL